jgi:hypothetical protein
MRSMPRNEKSVVPGGGSATSCAGCRCRCRAITERVRCSTESTVHTCICRLRIAPIKSCPARCCLNISDLRGPADVGQSAEGDAVDGGSRTTRSSSRRAAAVAIPRRWRRLRHTPVRWAAAGGEQYWGTGGGRQPGQKLLLYVARNRSISRAASARFRFASGTKNFSIFESLPRSLVTVKCSAQL